METHHSTEPFYPDEGPLFTHFQGGKLPLKEKNPADLRCSAEPEAADSKASSRSQNQPHTIPKDRFIGVVCSENGTIDNQQAAVSQEIHNAIQSNTPSKPPRKIKNRRLERPTWALPNTRNIRANRIRMNSPHFVKPRRTADVKFKTFGSHRRRKCTCRSHLVFVKHKKEPEAPTKAPAFSPHEPLRFFEPLIPSSRHEITPEPIPFPSSSPPPEAPPPTPPQALPPQPPPPPVAVEVPPPPSEPPPKKRSLLWKVLKGAGQLVAAAAAAAAIFLGGKFVGKREHCDTTQETSVQFPCPPPPPTQLSPPLPPPTVSPPVEHPPAPSAQPPKKPRPPTPAPRHAPKPPPVSVQPPSPTVPKAPEISPQSKFESVVTDVRRRFRQVISDKIEKIKKGEACFWER